MGSFALNTSAKHSKHINMKFLVLAAFVAVGSAQTLVTHPNGAIVPADTPAVAAAKAAHFGAVYPYAYAHPGALVAHVNGAVVPVDPADVVAARAEHLKAHVSA